MTRETRYAARERTIYRRTVRRQRYAASDLNLDILARELGAVVR